MPVKIRLRRAGRTHKAVYQLVAADSRMPRDGRFLEKLGTYDPNFDPPKVYVDHNKALKWLRNGAQLSETTRSLLSREGVLVKFHHERLGDDPARIQEAYETWKKDQELKVTKLQAKASEKKQAEAKQRQEAETAIRNKRLEERAAREAEARAAEEAAKAEAEAAKADEAAEAEAPAEEVSTEEASTETTEATAAETTNEENKS